MQIKNLKIPSLLQLNKIEGLKLIEEVRFRRNLKPPKLVKQKTPSVLIEPFKEEVRKKKKEEKLQSVLTSLTPEQIKMFQLLLKDKK